MTTSSDMEQWPAIRRQVIRQALWTVLWRGPLFGLGLAVVVLGAAAGLCYHRGGQTLDFGWFQLAGQAGAPVFPVYRLFWTYAPVAASAAMIFLAYVAVAGIVTCELAYRRWQRSANQSDT